MTIKKESLVILSAALVTEGLIILVACILAGLFSAPVTLNFSIKDSLLGVMACLPLLLFNEILWRYGTKNPSSAIGRFSAGVVVPLCRQTPPWLALILAILSGFGEELLFRGVLDSIFTSNFSYLLSALITSVLFAYVHFIGQLRRYSFMMVIYTLVGLYLWCVAYLVGSLSAVMITHAVYNFTVILLVRRRTR